LKEAAAAGGRAGQSGLAAGLQEGGPCYFINRYDGICVYYAIWWEGKTVQRKVGRKFWQKGPCVATGRKNQLLDKKHRLDPHYSQNSINQ
jgi:hypothetical protein